MPISENQLDTWSHQGAIATSTSTYATVRAAIDRAGLPYSAMAYRVFLQGSYGNDTNIYADSDVDVVICLSSTYQPDTSALSQPARQWYNNAHQGSAAYQLSNFKHDVSAALISAFRGDVYGGSKAIHIRANGNRRKADVLVAIDHYKYSMYVSDQLETHVSGVMFSTTAGKAIVNYPDQHMAACTAKHQMTGNRFKPTVRIFKNLRNFLTQAGLLAEGSAPSYFIEGLLYNVPNGYFVNSKQTTVSGIIQHLRTTNRAQFNCANGQHRLHYGDPDLCWDSARCDEFLRIAQVLWDNWR